MSIDVTNDLKAVLAEYSHIPEYSGLNPDSVDARTLFGNLPIHVGAFRGIVKELEVLIAAGADVNSTGEYGFTPLHNAVEEGHLEAVKFLIRAGADPGLRTDDMELPIDLSRLLGYQEISDFLAAL